ncbi:efflux RND transporter periplasmic adaptor subunit [Thiohalobacter thiocyanaticus]|uniref:Efflux RND transporter periplasmic adaptor subunit n=1 Tax=Thiohalobacter thiocyanaticus TaxID=585455 RepID=A0A426QKS4_9GAMM|nr:efflux RND transporter periplasmic adaptor subunit [Thiohalobacter thiocyanaticus]RRQ22340.1 efflux RND transporter periplasmic adaptor subunit [Thiohalobacter thiocyanaticus]
MKSLSSVFLCTALLFSPSLKAMDNHLQLTSGQLESLGIETTTVTATDQIGGRTLPARVRIPPDQNHAVTSLFAGRIAAIRVVEGQQVDAGQALIELNSPGLLEQQREYLDALNQRRLAQADHDRDKALFEAGIIPERRLLDTRVKLQAARATLAEQEQLLGLAGVHADAIARLQQTHRPRATVTLHAPVTGIVTELMTTAGQTVDAGEGLAQVAAVDPLWLEIRLAAEQASELKPGMKIQLTEPPGLGGTLLSIGQRVDPATNTLSLWARLDADAAAMRPGQLVNVRIAVAGRDNGWNLPAAAVFRHGDTDHVFVRTEDGFIATPVQVIGHRDDRVVLHSPELSADSMVAISGIAALKAAWLGMGGGE